MHKTGSHYSPIAWTLLIRLITSSSVRWIPLHTIFRLTPVFPTAGAVTTEKRTDNQVP